MKKILLRILSPLHKPVLLRGLMSKRGVERGFNPPCTTFQNGLARFPFSPGTEQWRLKPLFLVELTLASVLRESSKSIAWLLMVKRHIPCRIDLRDGHDSSHQSFLHHRASSVRAA